VLKGNELKQHKEKLERVNNIIRDIASKTPNITPIVPADQTLFEEFFTKEERHTYGNSWLYITQSAFGIGSEDLGYKYYDGKNLCALSIHPKIEQPDIIMLYWIRPMGEEILPIIIDLAEKIKQKYNVYSYVKKLFSDQYEFLLQHGFRSTTEFPWHSTTHSEDDTYPELIFDREKTKAAIFDSPKRSRLGRILREVRKLGRDNTIEITSVDFQKHAWEIVNHYFTKYSEFASKINISSPFDYYNMIFLDDSRNDNIEKKIMVVNDNPVGFYVLMHDDRMDTTNLYSCITLRQQYKYLTDYFFINMFDTGKTKYINIGGSEDEGIHIFKSKYQPIKEDIMYWATNYFS